ncbi:lanthionine synthetase-like protein [Stackebrandtia albiflava]|uniref:Lanthionine synthetase-like protein n=1 Tax=Stackebrandtia albiflava TaxID=406432 RepID=A0A562UL77_9ACTN|nr:lanthionine synthetase LanC family protein [Stackebrandtia albiflava]TWJ06362.1 lanthionine synthetase-like protein [Stackebrandtia albiflava]
MNPAGRRAEAARVVRIVAERLRNPAHVKAVTVAATGDGGDAATSAWRDLSLSAGFAGVALLYAELSATEPEWRTVLHDHLTAVVAAARDDVTPGAFGGRGAALVALRAARRATGDYRAAERKMAAAVETALARAVRRPIPTPVAFPDYDAVAGPSGVLGLVEAGSATARDTVEWLSRLCTSTGDRPGWWVEHGPNPHVAPPDGGHGNLGLAHGAAGILAALARAPDGTGGGGRAAAHRLADWLLAHRRVDGFGPWWPMFVTDDSATDRVRPAPTWCYGAPGIAVALRSAADRFDRPELREAADEAVAAALEAPVSLPDNGLCHGWAGLAHVLWRVDADRYRDTTETAMDRVLHGFTEDAAFGFRCHGDTGDFDHPGFLEGAAGTALALHRYAVGEPPRSGWDDVLLL